jgi:O-6-methylguanine DNA methyltransferase
VSVTRVAYTVDGWGVGELWVEGTRLVWHELPRPRPSQTERAKPRLTPPDPRPGGVNSHHPLRSTIPPESNRKGSGTAPEVKHLVQLLGRYFSGEPVAFSGVELGLDDLTPFQRNVVSALRSVRWGEIVSYAELARVAGHPNAQRAAGTFCAHNRFPLVLPCHRVVAANGIGSYGSLGIEYKRRLLELEGVAL